MENVDVVDYDRLYIDRRKSSRPESGNSFKHGMLLHYFGCSSYTHQRSLLQKAACLKHDEGTLSRPGQEKLHVIR